MEKNSIKLSKADSAKLNLAFYNQTYSTVDDYRGLDNVCVGLLDFFGKFFSFYFYIVKII